jgi:hypothetical protein
MRPLYVPVLLPEDAPAPRFTPRRVPTTALPARRARPRPLLNWRAVAAAMAVGVLLVSGVLAWLVTHPSARKAPEPVVTQADPVPDESARDPQEGGCGPALDERPVVARAPTEVLVPVQTLVPAGEPAQPAPEADPPRPAGVTCGTSVEFVSNPVDAAAQARREKKLLFVLHVSGNFEDPQFT